MHTTFDTIIVGGGLSGLVAACRLGRAGQRVALLEGRRQLGGRARTREAAGLRFNLGPHALYAAGAARRELDALEIAVHGAPAPLDGAIGWYQGRGHALPVGFVSLLATGLLGLGAKLEIARLLARLDGIEPEPLRGRTFAGWLDALGPSPRARALLEALARLSTYADAPAVLDAGATVRQLQRAGAGVLYLHGGWQSLVDGLAQAATAAGVEILEGTPARQVEHANGAVVAVHPEGGPRLRANAVVLAVPPAQAAKLVPGLPDAAGWSDAGLEARAACLEVGLEALPKPGRVFGLGIDTPDYASVHTSVAKLGDGHVVHVARYLAPGATEPEKAELLEVLERLQPGFQARATHIGYHPRMTVSYGLPRASAGGRRPGPEVPRLRGLYLAGDWVGEEGLLADAACASAARAAELIVAQAARARAA